MRHRRRAFSLVAMVACALAIFRGPAASQQNSDALPKLKDGFDVNAMDKSIDPCVDF
jgi:hypothetical protein